MIRVSILGVILSYVPGLPEIEIEPELILAVVLPPILYAAAVNVPVTDFRRNLRAITGLFGHPVGSWGEAAGGEEHAESVVLAVAETASEAAV